MNQKNTGALFVRLVAASIAFAYGSSALAAVSVSESGSLKRAAQAGKPVKHPSVANAATGSVSLIDSSGLEWFINTNINFSTTSSASAAVSEASYTGPVNADTLMGGVVASTLNDGFDGGNTVCTSTTATGNCSTGSASYVIYNQLGSAPTGSCSEAGGNRLYTFPLQATTAAPNVTLQRSIYIPSGDTFARWLNVLTNNGTSTQTINLISANNLGSDGSTKITASSSGALSSITSPANTWVASFQDWSGSTSSDVRLGHVFSGVGAQQGLAGINFVDGDDNPYWHYSVTLLPGQTKIIAQFATGQPTRAAAAAKAAALAGNANFDGNMGNCLTPTAKAQIVNFATTPPPTIPVFSLPILAGLSGLLGLVGLGFGYRRRNRDRT